MKYEVIYSPKAEEQLGALYEFISVKAGDMAAAKFVSSIVDYCDSFATFPERGALRDDLRKGLRIIGFRRRVTIAFSVEAKCVNILGIYYGGQDFEVDIEEI